MKQILFAIFVCLPFILNAQQKVDSGFVNVHVDSRIANVVNKPSNVTKGYIGTKRGFRVQIYNGNDRKKASQVKVDFMRAFPGVRAYMVYANPQFRIRVGDFTARSDASAFSSKLASKFSPCMVVPDVVNVNTVRNAKAKINHNDNND